MYIGRIMANDPSFKTTIETLGVYPERQLGVLPPGLSGGRQRLTDSQAKY